MLLMVGIILQTKTKVLEFLEKKKLCNSWKKTRLIASLQSRKLKEL